jgi:hypothetical protein
MQHEGEATPPIQGIWPACFIAEDLGASCPKENRFQAALYREVLYLGVIAVLR